MASAQPTDDRGILARLEAYGPYAYHRPSWFWRWTGLLSEIEWDSPPAFGNDLAPTSVALWFPSKRISPQQSLPPLLDAMDAFRADLPARIVALRSYLLAGFRETIENQLLDWEKEQMADAGGHLSDVAILAQVRSMHLRFDSSSGTLLRTGWLDVGWDEEHGLDIEWDALGRIVVNGGRDEVQRPVQR